MSSSKLMEFYEVVKTRRSIRSYKDTKIPEESLMRVLDAARLAPSGHNRQFWKFYVVEDEDKKKKVAEACNGQTWIAQAPMVIVATGGKIPFNRGGYMGEMSFIMDVSIAFTHLILAARAEGLGTCWIGSYIDEEVKKALDIPAEEHVVAVTPLGYPDRGGFTDQTKRKSLEEIIERI